MLYYIIPPIIIVLSLAFLIHFLFRKFSGEGLVNAEILEEINNAGSMKSGGNKIGFFISHLWFRMLEKATQRMKLFSLKMHNASNSWFHSAKSRRERINLEEKDQQVEMESGNNASEQESVVRSRSSEAGVIGGLKRRVTVANKPRLENFSIRQGIVRKRFVSAEKEEPAKPAPMEKNRLEEALIKRIAVNPKDIEAYERLGDYYSDIKNFKDAVECYKQVTKLSPRNLKAKVKLRSLERILKR